MNKEIQFVIYWDSSSILSALFRDSHSREALMWSRKQEIHLISTLTYADVCAVISRLKRERLMTDLLIDAALEALEKGPWRHLNIWPGRKEIKALSMKWALRGADLWHLAVAKTLQVQIPELILFTFDNRLRVAAEREGLIRK